ncbi:MAG TPA: hypothetical protein PLS03_00445 [Terrimicrobiaceae bacterium]|nr:hypothetical protein [Terrimicrobiaceae bacterium]
MFAVDEYRFAQTPFFCESALLIGPHGPLVRSKNVQADAVQVEIAKAEFDKQPHGLAAEALSLVRLLSNAYLKLGGPVNRANLVQLACADGFFRTAVLNDEEDGIGPALHHGRNP